MIKKGDKVRFETMHHTTGEVVYIHPRGRFCVAEARFSPWDKFQGDEIIREAFVLNGKTGEIVRGVD